VKKARSTSRDCRVRIAGLTLFVALGAAAGCYPKGAPPPKPLTDEGVSKASAKFAGETAESLKEGHDLFIAKCNGCHDYPDLVAVSEEDWPSIMKRMADKSDVPPEKGDKMLHYVLAARSEQAAK
jgi:cytochrome c5